MLRPVALVEQPAVGLDAVLDGPGVGPLGGQAVVDIEDPAADGVGQVPGQPLVRLSGPEDVTAAVEVLEDPIVGALGRNGPDGRDTARVDLRVRHPLWFSRHLAHHPAVGPHLLEGGRGHGCSLRSHVDHRSLECLGLFAGHGEPSFVWAVVADLSWCLGQSARWRCWLAGFAGSREALVVRAGSAPHSGRGARGSSCPAVLPSSSG